MTQPTSTAPAASAEPHPPHVRALKFLVIAMGVMIVVGLLTVIGRIVYLASTGPRQAAVASSSIRLAPSVKLALPAGAHIRQVSLSGDRLAVHYETASGTGIALINLASGAIVSRIEVVPELPQ